MSQRDIFTAARAMTDPAARSAYLDGACGADSELRARVEALLRAHDQPDSLLDYPAVAPRDPDPSATQATTGTPDPGVAAAQTTGGGNGASDDEALAFLAPATRPDSLGRIGHYEVLQVLGRGGFGIVFRAFDEMLQRVVALKVMAPQLAATSPARKRFLREARSSAQVRHENVVQVYEVAEQPLPYLAMEFIPGETLQQRLDRVGPLDVPEVLRIGRQIAEGLAAAHATDLIHRDIKPGNVLLEGGPHKVKITDFGLARAADDASISQSGIIAGTPMYMAPEQAQGQTLDQRADLFSLGSVLYQMAAGRPPFRATGTLAVLKRVAEDRPRAIREIIPETPQWLCDIIAKLHAKNPDDRYQSAREVADVLADCETQLKASAKLKDYSRIPHSKPRRSGRWKWAAAIALLLPVVALAATEITGVTHLLHNQQRSQQPPLPLADADTLPVQDISGHWVGKSTQAPNDSWFFSCEMTLKQAGKNVTGTRRIAPINNPNVFGLIEIKGTTDGHTIQFEDVKILESTIGGGQRWLLGRQNLKITKAKVLRLDGVWQAEGVSGRNTLERIDPKKLDDGAPTKYGDPEYTNTLGMKFKLIPAGKFTMGSPKEEIDRCLKQFGPLKENLPTEGPEHPVEITQPFYLGGTEVTVGQFRQFVDEEGYQVGDGRWRNPGFDQTDQHPVVWVSWNNAVDFCKWLSKKEGKEYRLPTEAEWEYSCRAGKAGSRYGFGDDDAQLENHAWYDKNSRGGTHPVGKKKPNSWGLYDIHGNAAELCQDNYDPDYYKNSPAKDPPGGADHGRAVRGGSCRTPTVLCRSAFRGYVGPDAHHEYLTGFRVLLVSPPGGVGTEGGAKDKPAATAIAPFTDADRRAAEYVLSIGGTVRVDGNDSDIRAKGELPTEAFRLTFVYLAGNKQVTDSGLAAFKDCKNLTSLDLYGCGQVTDAGLAHFKDCKNLSVLQLEGVQVTDAALVDFAGYENLTNLQLGNTRVTDAGLVYLKDCKKLTAIQLLNTPVTDAGLAHFKDCKNLTSLDLRGTKLTDAGLAYFKDRKNLSVLWLDSTSITDAGLALFEDCKNLTSLQLANTSITDAGLAHFKDSKKLTCLLLQGTQVRDAGLAPFKDMPLRELMIYNTGITDLTPLQDMPLETIRLTPKNITKGLDILRGMKPLKNIGISNNQAWSAAEFWERYDKGGFKE